MQDTHRPLLKTAAHDYDAALFVALEFHPEVWRVDVDFENGQSSQDTWSTELERV